MATANQIGRRTSYGYIWMNTGNWTGVSFSRTTSYQELTGLSTAFTLKSPSQDFAMTTDGRLKYTGIHTKRFVVNATVSAQSTFIKLYKNGVALDVTEDYGTSRNRIPSFSIDLATNDYISIWIKGFSATSINITQITLSATSTDRR